MFFAQFVALPYRAILYATGRQINLNGISVVWLVVRHGIALLASYLYGTAVAYLMASILCMLLELASYRIATWRWLAVDKSRRRTDQASIKSILRATGPLTVCVVISLVAMQIDKWVVATQLSTDLLGRYTIATTLGLGILNFFVPIANAYQPVVIQLAANPGALRALNIRLLKLFVVGALSIVIGYVLLGDLLLLGWLRNAEYAESIYPVLGILIVGSTLNAMYNIGYMTWLAHGHIHKILRANIVSLATVILVVPITTHQYGLSGAAVGWLLSNALCLILSLDWLMDKPHHALIR
jgi:O-antigen/teichoic acid export membrane protein